MAGHRRCCCGPTGPCDPADVCNVFDSTTTADKQEQWLPIPFEWGRQFRIRARCSVAFSARVTETRSSGYVIDRNWNISTSTPGECSIVIGKTHTGNRTHSLCLIESNTNMVCPGLAEFHYLNHSTNPDRTDSYNLTTQSNLVNYLVDGGLYSSPNSPFFIGLDGNPFSVPMEIGNDPVGLAPMRMLDLGYRNGLDGGDEPRYGFQDRLEISYPQSWLGDPNHPDNYARGWLDQWPGDTRASDPGGAASHHFGISVRGDDGIWFTGGYGAGSGGTSPPGFSSVGFIPFTDYNVNTVYDSLEESRSIDVVNQPLEFSALVEHSQEATRSFTSPTVFRETSISLTLDFGYTVEVITPCQSSAPLPPNIDPETMQPRKQPGQCAGCGQ